MEHVLWVEKYRPKKIADCVLPETLKGTFQKFVDMKSVPNLLLVGTPGIGKTTVARAMLEELECDYIIFNGSLNVDKATLRTDIQSYASTMSMQGGRKYVILDEADYLSPAHVQPALRNFMEEFSKNCGFILTCNYKNKLIPPLHSRCSVVEFSIEPSERQEMARQFLGMACQILDKENVEYDKKVVAHIVSKYFPDWRRVINELQRQSATGTIDIGAMSSSAGTELKELIHMLKKKEFTEMRKWIGKNSSIDSATLMRSLYDASTTIMEPGSIPALVLILADYQYKSAFVTDHEINLAACMTEIMTECKFL